MLVAIHATYMYFSLPQIHRPYNSPPKAPAAVPLQTTFNCRHRNCNIGANDKLTPQKLHNLDLQSHLNKHMSFLRTLSPLKSFLTTRAFTTTARTMAPAKQEWLVILPDYTGKLAERNQVRAYVLKHPRPNPPKILSIGPKSRTTR